MTVDLAVSDALDPWQYRVEETSGATLCVTTGPGLPATRVLDSTSAEIGLILGFAIDLAAAARLGEVYEFDGVVGAAAYELADRIRDGLGGNFVLILHYAGVVSQLYPDAAAQVPCVFDPNLKVAGSTAHAILDAAAYDNRFLKDSFEAMEIERDGWFPAGATAHEGVERLLPNHYLDLKTWEVVRFWPMEEIERTGSPEAVAEEIISIVRRQIEALVKSDRTVAQALTAGHETRWLLACARPFISDVEFVTVEPPSRTHIDADIAGRLATAFGLTHRILPRKIATSEQQALYLRRGGHCSGSQNQVTHPSMWALAERHCFVGGFNGEVARGYLWRVGDRIEMDVPPEMLMARLGLPASADINARFRRWRDGIPLCNALDILDLNYLENRVGPWAYAQFNCDPSVPRYNPIGTPRTVKLMLSLPEEWRRTYRLSRFAIERCWPELAGIPINTRGRFRDLVDKVGLAVTNPERVIRKLRKLSK
jgi:hypothetical protein